MRPIRVLVVDHNPLLREGIAVLVRIQDDMEVAAVASTAYEAVAMYLEQRPHVALIDLDLAARAGVDAIRSILMSNPDARVVGLATYCEDKVCKTAIEARAHSCVAKGDLSETLPGLIRAIVRTH